MRDLQKYLDIIGYPVKDKVTGYEGIATSVNFELYGCIIVDVRPKAVTNEKDGTTVPTGHWFDFKRLIKLNEVRVMDAPTFAEYADGTFGNGGDSKTSQRSGPSSR